MLIGHKKQWNFLEKIVQAEKIPHALLFLGQEKLGKRTAALEFVKLVNGKDSLKRQHPDLILVEPEGKEIKVKQIEEFIKIFSLKPYSAPYKIGIIDNAHLANQEAQNWILKTLEEPKGNAILILISNSLYRLLPTIISRCQIVKFYPVDNKEIESYLNKQGLSNEEIKELSDMSLGRPGIAIDLLSCPDKWRFWRGLIKKIYKMPQLDLASRFQYAKELSQEPSIAEVLEIWLLVFRKILLEKCLDQNKDKLKNQYGSYSVKRLKTIIEQIQKTIFLTSQTGVNHQLALEILMLYL